MEIPFGAGVCGTTARHCRTTIVADVGAFPGHITCDPGARSEIVVPAFAARGALLAVLDIDSVEPSRFDNEDRTSLENLLEWFSTVM